jgi:hypothetical protein
VADTRASTRRGHRSPHKHGHHRWYALYTLVSRRDANTHIGSHARARNTSSVIEPEVETGSNTTPLGFVRSGLRKAIARFGLDGGCRRVPSSKRPDEAGNQPASVASLWSWFAAMQVVCRQRWCTGMCVVGIVFSFIIFFETKLIMISSILSTRLHG